MKTFIFREFFTNSDFTFNGFIGIKIGTKVNFMASILKFKINQKETKKPGGKSWRIWRKINQDVKSRRKPLNSHKKSTMKI